jgi:Zn ribbon nucleic-acid-binding protein
MVIDDDKYDVEDFCPKCGSADVILEFNNGYYRFNRCRKCGHRAQEGSINFNPSSLNRA